MKTFIKLLLSVGAIVALAFTASAFDQLKGGQLQTGQTLQAVQPATATAAPALAMSCPKCKEVSGTSSTPLGKGAFVKAASYHHHACDGCKTTTSTTGMGKAQATQSAHSCSSGVDVACCAMK